MVALGRRPHALRRHHAVVRRHSLPLAFPPCGAPRSREKACTASVQGLGARGGTEAEPDRGTKACGGTQGRPLKRLAIEGKASEVGGGAQPMRPAGLGPRAAVQHPGVHVGLPAPSGHTLTWPLPEHAAVSEQCVPGKPNNFATTSSCDSRAAAQHFGGCGGLPVSSSSVSRAAAQHSDGRGGRAVDKVEGGETSATNVTKLPDYEQFNPARSSPWSRSGGDHRRYGVFTVVRRPSARIGALRPGRRRQLGAPRRQDRHRGRARAAATGTTTSSRGTTPQCTHRCNSAGAAAASRSAAPPRSPPWSRSGSDLRHYGVFTLWCGGLVHASVHYGRGGGGS